MPPPAFAASSTRSNAICRTRQPTGHPIAYRGTPMDRKTFSIGILSLTALILAVACLFPAKPAQADFAVKDVSRLQLVTVTSQQGGNVLYLIDPVGGKILVLGW